MVATGLERTEVAAGPMVAVVLEGVGLGGTTALELLSDGRLVASGGGVVATSGKVSAVFDLSGVAADTELWVRAKDGAGRLATSPVPLRVTQTAQAQLEFWLDLPDAVREGRTYRGQVRYRNAGDTDMEAPIFKVFDSLENATVSPSMNSAFALDGCLLTGRGNGTPWIVLKAGDEGAVDFYYTVMGANQLEVRWIKGGGGARTAEWLEMMAKEERRQLAVAEAAAAAEAEWAATGAQALAEFIAANTLTPVEAATG